MNENEQDRMKKLLRQALPPIKEDAEPGRDLWPAVLTRLDARPAPPWFDWALAAGLAAAVAVFPAWIPLLLYYL
jgi:anti-sigma factor RsiW